MYMFSKKITFFKHMSVIVMSIIMPQIGKDPSQIGRKVSSSNLD